MNWINAQLTALTELLLSPLAATPRVALLVISVACGVAMTFVFRHTSNQAALRRVADRTKAQLLCMRIFKDELGVALRCQRDLLKLIGLRLWHSVPPMLVLIVPFVFILIQLAQRYENRPLRPGEAAVAVVHLAAAPWRDASADLPIQVPAGVAVETPALRDPVERAVYWRLRLEEPTDEPLRWYVGSHVIEKSFVGSDDAGRLRAVSARRPGRSFWSRLLYPAEPAFGSADPVEAVEIRYPRRSTPFFGVDIPWWATFLIASMATALLARPFLRVQF